MKKKITLLMMCILWIANSFAQVIENCSDQNGTCFISYSGQAPPPLGGGGPCQNPPPACTNSLCDLLSNSNFELGTTNMGPFNDGCAAPNFDFICGCTPGFGPPCWHTPFGVGTGGGDGDLRYRLGCDLFNFWEDYFMGETWDEQQTNTRYLSLRDFNFDSGVVHTSIGHVFQTPMPAGQYVLGYWHAFSFSTTDDCEFWPPDEHAEGDYAYDIFFDPSNNLCSNAAPEPMWNCSFGWPNAQRYAPTGQSQVFTFQEANVPTHDWEFESILVTVPAGVTHNSMYIYPHSPAQHFDPSEAIYHHFDDFALIPTAMNPIVVNVTNNYDCTSNQFTVTISVQMAYNGTNNVPITLDLDWDAALNLIPGGGFLGNGNWTIPTGFLSSTPSTFNATLLFNLGAVPGTEYFVSANALAGGCLMYDPIPTGAVFNVLPIEVVTQNVLCNGESNGSIDVTILGGQLPFTITWNGNVTTVQDQLDIPAGTYVLNITDNGGCAFNATYNITQPPPLQIVQQFIVDPPCDNPLNSGILVEIGGGTPDYSQTTLQTESNFFSEAFVYNIGSANYFINQPSAGTYDITFIDLNGCSLEHQVVIEGLAVEAITSNDCLGPLCVNLNISGATQPVTFAWTGPFNFTATTEDIYPTNPGTYTVIVNDNGGCTWTGFWNVNPMINPSPPPFFSTPPGNTVWTNQDYVFDQDLIVNANTLLVVNGGTMLFSPGVGIVVMPDGEFNGNGTIFDWFCEAHWKGMEGAANGTVRSTIRLLDCEVRNSSSGYKNYRTQAGIPVTGTFGGELFATTTLYYNNRRDLEFWSYHNFSGTIEIPYQSSAAATSCQLVLDENFWNWINPSERVSLFDVRSVEFNETDIACYTSIWQDDQAMIGIRASSATYRVLGCNLDNNCTSRISGFTYGIHGTQGNKAFPIIVDEMDFECYRGMYQQAPAAFTITQNDFNELPGGFPENPFTFTEPLNTGAYGCYLWGLGTGDIQENIFRTDNYNVNLGLVVNDGGIPTKFVYGNSFIHQQTGSNFFNRNRNSNGLTGLKFECNRYFDNTMRDVFVFSPDFPATDPTRGIAAQQGTPTEGAGNTFTQVPAPFDDMRSLFSPPFTYHYNVIDGLVPAECSGPITLVPNADENECNTNLFQGGGGEHRMSAENSYNEVHGEWMALVDGGDTESLTDDVINSTFSEAIALYYELMQKSPNLSEEVMVEAIKQEVDLPAVLLTQILSSNPCAAKSERVNQEIENRWMPLDEYQKEQILQGLEWVSLKEQYEAEMSALKMERDMAIWNSMLEISTNLENPDPSGSMIALLDNEMFLTDRWWKVELHLDKKDFSSAIVLLESTETDYALDEAELACKNELLDLIPILSSTNPLSESELIDLEYLRLNGSSWAGSIAQSVLTVKGEIEFQEPLYLPEWLDENKSLKQPKQNEDVLILYPNPASAFFIVKIVNSNAVLSHLEICDMIGRTLKSIPVAQGQTEFIIPIQEFANGTYFMNAHFESGRVVTRPVVKQ